jgi:ubiquitin C-terminal hydrolase
LARRLEDLERRKKKQQSPAASFPQEEKGEKEKEEPFLDPGGSCLPCELDFLVSEFYGNGCGVGSSTGSNTAVTTAGTTAGNTASTTVVPTSNTPAGAPIVPSKFLHAWWQVAPKHLAGQGQQDAHEFFIHLVSAAHLGFKKETVREAGEKNTGLVLKKDDHAARVGSIPGGDVVSPPTFQTETHTKEKDTDITKCPCPMHRAFAGTLRSDVTCGSCQVVSTAFDETVGLSLDVPNGGSRSLPKAVTLEQCFAKFIRPERLSDDLNSGGGSSFRCPSCGDSKSKKTKQMSVRTFPRTLVTHVKRFARGQKIHTHVQFPFTLDVNPYSSSFAERDRARFRGIHGTRRDSSDPSDPAAQQNEASKFMYELFAVIVHSGNLDSGHYVRVGAFPNPTRCFKPLFDCFPCTTSNNCLQLHTSQVPYLPIQCTHTSRLSD